MAKYSGQFFFSEKIFNAGSITDLQTKETDQNILRRFFKAGLTPDFAENAKEAEVLEGQFEVCHIYFLNASENMKTFVKHSRSSSFFEFCYEFAMHLRSDFCE